VLGRLYLTTERLLFFDEVPGLPMMALSGMLLAAILPGTRRIDVTLKDISVVRILQTFPKNVWGRRRQARSLVIEGPGMYYELRVNVDRWLPALLDELGRPEDHVVLIMKGDEWRFIS